MKNYVVRSRKRTVLQVVGVALAVVSIVVVWGVVSRMVLLGGEANVGDVAEIEVGGGGAGEELVPVQDVTLHNVSRVVDGDTIDVDIEGAVYRVRLIGINTPETVKPNSPQECFGAEASRFLTGLLEGNRVALERDDSQDDKDVYGRLLRYVYLDGENVNLLLIAEGYAYEYTYNVPYAYQAEFRAAQREASENERGLWSAETCGGG